MKDGKKNDNHMGLGMCLGLPIGGVLGQLTCGNFTIGMCIGMLLGMAVGAVWKSTSN